MPSTWILVAHRGGARLLESTGPGEGLALRQDLPNPQGKLKSKDLGSDEPGRAFDSHGGRHSFSQHQEPAAHLTEQFAKQLAALLEDGRTHNRYAHLVLVAEPHLLGLLRAALSAPTAALVTKTFDRDLGHVATHDLAKHLGAL
jgi:protein required for attachment to host cells